MSMQTFLMGTTVLDEEAIVTVKSVASPNARMFALAGHADMIAQ
jgi:hypothetical protein